MSTAKTTVVAALAAVLGCTVGYVTGSGMSPLVGGGLADPDVMEAVRQEGFTAGYAQARNDINQIFVDKRMSYPLDYPITKVYGTVVAVGSGSFDIEYDRAQFSVIDAGTKRARVRIVTGAKVTRIVNDEKKTEDIPTEDVAPASVSGSPVVTETGEPGGQNGDSSPAPVLAQVEIPAAVADITVGSYVMIDAQADVRSSDQFDAITIVIQNTANLAPGTAPSFDTMPFSRGIVPNPVPAAPPTASTPPADATIPPPTAPSGSAPGGAPPSP